MKIRKHKYDLERLEDGIHMFDMKRRRNGNAPRLYALGRHENGIGIYEEGKAHITYGKAWKRTTHYNIERNNTHPYFVSS